VLVLGRQKVETMPGESEMAKAMTPTTPVSTVLRESAAATGISPGKVANLRD
jgi:hypothetical protein